MVNIDEISGLVFGAGAFNWEYNQEPALQDTPAVVKHALDSGFNAFDTAAAYGPSETILGDALEALGGDAKYARETYFLTSKAGRWEDDTFDFSAAAIRRSVARSLQRLKTPYLDLLIIHDVEFGSLDAVLEAVATAAALKAEGLTRHIGISGYPLPVLAAVVELAHQRQLRVDAVLSYCNMTLQNDLLLHYASQFRQRGVRLVFNASPLSMSLLRSRPTHDFHPAKASLRRRTQDIAQGLLAQGVELADAASQYAFANWDGPTVIGLRTKEQVDAALANHERGRRDPQPALWAQIIRDFGEYHNFTWPSP